MAKNLCIGCSVCIPSAVFARLLPRFNACGRVCTSIAAFARLSSCFTNITEFAAHLAPRWHAYRSVCTSIAAFASLSSFSYLSPSLYAFRTKLTEIKPMSDPLLNRNMEHKCLKVYWDRKGENMRSGSVVKKIGRLRFQYISNEEQIGPTGERAS
jgi:hypothetical protein